MPFEIGSSLGLEESTDRVLKRKANFLVQTVLVKALKEQLMKPEKQILAF